MNIQEHINYWLESAEYDLNAAESMYQTGYFVWCLFIGHLVLEKTLKAIYVQSSNNKVPPKIHNLLKLSTLSNLDLSAEQIDVFEDVNDFHIEGRYSEFKNELYKVATKQYTYENFGRIKAQYKWLKSQIK
jgi:HEPN domain-containing protein